MEGFDWRVEYAVSCFWMNKSTMKNKGSENSFKTFKASIMKGSF